MENETNFEENTPMPFNEIDTLASEDVIHEPLAGSSRTHSTVRSSARNDGQPSYTESSRRFDVQKFKIAHADSYLQSFPASAANRYTNGVQHVARIRKEINDLEMIEELLKKYKSKIEASLLNNGLEFEELQHSVAGRSPQFEATSLLEHCGNNCLQFAIGGPSTKMEGTMGHASLGSQMTGSVFTQSQVGYNFAHSQSQGQSRHVSNSLPAFPGFGMQYPSFSSTADVRRSLVGNQEGTESDIHIGDYALTGESWGHPSISSDPNLG